MSIGHCGPMDLVQEQSYLHHSWPCILVVIPPLPVQQKNGPVFSPVHRVTFPGWEKVDPISHYSPWLTDLRSVQFIAPHC
jgi:hypothetical protein